MNVAVVASKNGVLIRLTDERWRHITLLHPILANKQNQVLDTVKNPDYIFKGRAEELLAVSAISKSGYVVVVYKAEIIDGFIITAFETTNTRWLFKKEKIWSKRS